MPSITGGSSTDRDYAPHMYVLGEGGDPNNDADYHFVHNATKKVERSYGRYHIGVTSLEEVVCDFAEKRPEGYGYQNVHGIPSTDIPIDVARQALGRALRQIGSHSGNSFVRGIASLIDGIDVPLLPEPIDFSMMINGLEESVLLKALKNGRELPPEEVREGTRLKARDQAEKTLKAAHTMASALRQVWGLPKW